MEHMEITRRFYFCAGHRLFRPDWTEEKNNEIFGLCANPAGHGHNYTLELSVSGPIDPETGMIINLRVLKDVIEDDLIKSVDHKNLNSDVPWLEGQIPTTENVAKAFWEQINAILYSKAPNITVSRLVLQETPNNLVTITKAAT